MMDALRRGGFKQGNRGNLGYDGKHIPSKKFKDNYDSIFRKKKKKKKK